MEDPQRLVKAGAHALTATALVPCLHLHPQATRLSSPSAAVQDLNVCSPRLRLPVSATRGSTSSATAARPLPRLLSATAPANGIRTWNDLDLFKPARHSTIVRRSSASSRPTSTTAFTRHPLASAASPQRSRLKFPHHFDQFGHLKAACHSIPSSVIALFEINFHLYISTIAEPRCLHPPWINHVLSRPTSPVAPVLCSSLVVPSPRPQPPSETNVLASNDGLTSTVCESSICRRPDLSMLHALGHQLRDQRPPPCLSATFQYRVLKGLRNFVHPPRRARFRDQRTALHLSSTVQLQVSVVDYSLAPETNVPGLRIFD
ncbi:uncharacterized protein SCHCODRAFT_02565825 [Schizophyllum commune H4-8]|nr:uncharacterized protein SCHCODRAFT_02565825 [Schizophyllum commune H4-8]KAI5898088.1 hypothetical protein SCHCODRAFT_02565825 [Schizophyllum commune H4-8]